MEGIFVRLWAAPFILLLTANSRQTLLYTKSKCVRWNIVSENPLTRKSKGRERYIFALFLFLLWVRWCQWIVVKRVLFRSIFAREGLLLEIEQPQFALTTAHFIVRTTSMSTSPVKKPVDRIKIHILHKASFPSLIIALIKSS